MIAKQDSILQRTTVTIEEDTLQKSLEKALEKSREYLEGGAYKTEIEYRGYMYPPPDGNRIYQYHVESWKFIN